MPYKILTDIETVFATLRRKTGETLEAHPGDVVELDEADPDVKAALDAHLAAESPPGPDPSRPRRWMSLGRPRSPRPGIAPSPNSKPPTTPRTPRRCSTPKPPASPPSRPSRPPTRNQPPKTTPRFL
jgi:hypothetical protein